MSEKLLLTIDEAAGRIGMKRTFTYDLIRRGVLRSVKIGGARRVLVSDLTDFVRRLEEESDGDDLA